MGLKKGDGMVNKILELKNKNVGIKEIARRLNVSKNTVKKYLRETATETLPAAKSSGPWWSAQVSWNEILKSSRAGVDLVNLWETYCQSAQPLSAVPYVSFWREFRRRYPKLDLDFHKTHRPAERCEVDFKGDAAGLGFVDRATGEFIQCKLFGSVLCFSQLFFAEARLCEKQGEWLSGIDNGFRYFGGVPELLTVDNPKAMVTRADWWDPDLNPEFYKFCEHVGIAPVPARPSEPKDKNLIECLLGTFWRWAGPRVRARHFFSQGELNEFLVALCDDFNIRVQRKYGVSRRARFESEERALLKPLPAGHFEMAHWKKAKLHPDCHVQVNKNFFSAPYQLRGKELDVRISHAFVEIFFKLKRVALHKAPTGIQRGRYLTDAQHLPEAHQALLEMTPQGLLKQAAAIGPETKKLISDLITKSLHPLMFVRRCQGILRLQKRYGPEKLERVSTFLMEQMVESPRLREFEMILKNPNFEKAKIESINRNPNPHLRGQLTWRL
jgi:transposase